MDWYVLFRNWFLQGGFEGKIKGEIQLTGRRGRRCWQLMAELKE
jgi:hypothetical protein